MIIMKGLECSLLVSNKRENTRPEGLQVLEDWHRHLTAFHVHPEIPVVLLLYKTDSFYLLFFSNSANLAYFMHLIQHCCPSDSIVSEDAWIEPSVAEPKIFFGFCSVKEP
jgi:hypothetical protein